jgi:hypothetical protein
MPTKTPPEAVAEDAIRATDAATEAAEARLEDSAASVDEKIEAVSSQTDAAIDGFTISQQQAMQSMEAAGQAMMDGVTKLQKELVDFVSERIRQDVETQQAMLRCRSFDDMRDLQTRFFQTAVDQYSAEANRLMKLGSEIVQRSLEPTT